MGTDPAPERALEAILMVADEPQSLVHLATALDLPVARVDAAIRSLVADFDGADGGIRRGFELREVGGGWRFYVRKEFDPVVRDFVLTENPSKLSQAALETLAVIAYKQPITRGSIASIRAVNVEKLRNWPARWTLVGGVPPGPRYDAGAYKVPGASTGMYALKGDPLWEKLGSYAFFSDALGVDHPPFCFNSEMTWRPVKLAKALEEGITGPAGESIKQWLANLKGTAEEFQTPQLSTSGMDEGMKQALEDLTGITENEDALRYKDILAREIEASKSAYQRRNPDFNPDLQFKEGRWQ